MADKELDGTGEEDLSLELPRLFRRRKGEKAVEKAPEKTDVAEPSVAEAERAEPPAKKRPKLKRTKPEPRLVEPEASSASRRPEPDPSLVEPEASSASKDDETPQAENQPPPLPPKPDPSLVEPEASFATRVEQRAPASASKPKDDETPRPENQPPPQKPTRADPQPTWEPSAPEPVARDEVPEQPPIPEATKQPHVPLSARLSSVGDRLDGRFERLGDLRLPALSGPRAAALTGAVVGLVGVGLVLLALRGCGAVRGVGGCGAAGIFLVLGVAALMVVAGSMLLRAWGQTETLSTAFLAVGLLAVILMLFLLPVADRWFMVLVVPVLGVVTFALSWWVSNRVSPEARVINDEQHPEQAHR